MNTNEKSNWTFQPWRLDIDDELLNFKVGVNGCMLIKNGMREG